MKLMFRLFYFVFVSHILFATEFYIAPKPLGSDSNNGSASSPFATFSHAMGKLFKGDTLIVRAGIYHEKIKAVRSGEIGKPITIKGELDASGKQLSFINPGKLVSGWTAQGLGVYKASFSGEASSMILEKSGETYDIAKICHYKITATAYCNSWLRTLQTPADKMYFHSSGYPNHQTVSWWDGIEAAYASDGHSLFLRFRGGENPDTIGKLRVTTLGATVGLGQFSNIKIQDLKIKASQFGVYINGGSNNIVENNLIINGQRKVQIDNLASGNSVINNKMYAKSYSTYVNGSRIGYGVSSYADFANTDELKKNIAINYHSYSFYKYRAGSSSSSADESGIYVMNASACKISGNDISEGDDGIIAFNTNDCEFSDNEIYDMHGNGILFGYTNRKVSVFNNLISNNNSSLRFGRWDKSTFSGIFYNNRLWNPQNVGMHIKWHLFEQKFNTSWRKIYMVLS